MALTAGVSEDVNNALFTLISDDGDGISTSSIRNVSYGKSASFTPQTIMNRSSEVMTYASSSAIPISVTIDIFALSADAGADQAQELHKTLMGLTFPQQSGTKPPPLCRLTLYSGVIFKDYPVIVTDVSVSIDDNSPYTTAGDPHRSSVTLSMKGIELKAQDKADWSGGSSATLGGAVVSQGGLAQ